MSTIAFNAELTSANFNAALGFSSNSSSSLTAGVTISIITTDRSQSWTVSSSSGAVTLANAPFGSTPPPDRSIIILIGTSDSNYPVIEYADVANGVLTNGPLELKKGKVGVIMYVSSLSRYVEVSRS